MMRRVDISHKTIFFIAIFLGILWLTYQLLDVIIIIFVAIIFMSALSPAVDKLVSWKIPKALAIALSYLVVLGVLVGLLSLIVTPLITQTTSLVGNLPQTIERILPSLGVERNVLQTQLTEISRNALSITLIAFSNLVTFISIAVITFYLLLDRERLYRSIVQFFPDRKLKIEGLIYKIESKLGSWLRGQVVLSFIIGLLSYLLLLAFQIPYALPLAIIAGIMEVVPVIGPIISAVPAVLIALVISPATALFVGLGYFAIQQAENHLIVPQVMKRAVGLNPLIVIIAIAVGGKLLGISGALLAVPVAVVIQIVIEEVLNIELESYYGSSTTTEIEKKG